MSIITRMLKQRAVYWEPQVRDRYGEPVHSDPIEIRCRWEDVNVEFITLEGRNVISNARVYVDRDLEVGGILWLGTLDALVSEADFRKNPGAMEIRRFDKLPNLRNTRTLRTAML